MLYLGLEPSGCCFEISAVSNNFTFLGKELFPENCLKSLDSWISSLLLKDNEPVSWFFRKKIFLSNDFTDIPFTVSKKLHSCYLVKDRIVLDFYHLMREIDYNYNRINYVDISFILSLSLKLFDPQYIYSYSEPGELNL